MTKTRQDSLPWDAKADAEGSPSPESQSPAESPAKPATIEPPAPEGEEALESPESAEDAPSEPKRSVMSLQDRIDVVDAIRSRAEPFVGRSRGDLARQVAEASGVSDLNGKSLWYLVEQTPKFRLAEKLVVLEEEKPEDQLRLLRADVAEIQAGRQALVDATHLLIDRVSASEKRIDELRSQVKVAHDHVGAVVNEQAERLESLATIVSEAVEDLKARFTKFEERYAAQ